MPEDYEFVGGYPTPETGPEPPEGRQGHWIQTLPGTGWFVYFRIYGPEQAAFDGTWRPGDFLRS